MIDPRVSWFLSIMHAGTVKRSPQEEMSLRVRMTLGIHLDDVFQKCKDELGNRAKEMGPIDISMNPFRDNQNARGKAYLIPPACTGLSPELAAMIGDATASTTKAKYAGIGATPMPTAMQGVCSEALHYRIGCNYVGVAVGWSDRSERPYLRTVRPDCLEVEYASDDPLSPTRITERIVHEVGGKDAICRDVYDLTDLGNPSYRVLTESGADVTEAVFGYTPEGDAYWWRYADGRPFHRIVVSGDPRNPYRGIELVEGTLTAAVLMTHWKAGVRDAGFPRMHAIGLHLVGSDSNAANATTGTEAGPEIATIWEHDNEQRPGTLQQFGPGFDPEVIGRAIRDYCSRLISSTGLPVSLEGTGGEPTETERRALDEAIAATYPACRGQDVLLLRRVAAVVNRKTGSTHPEGGYGVLYREEVEDALERAGQSTKKPDENDNT
jgi:hypothetical protein